MPPPPPPPRPTPTSTSSSPCKERTLIATAMPAKPTTPQPTTSPPRRLRAARSYHDPTHRSTDPRNKHTLRTATTTTPLALYALRLVTCPHVTLLLEPQSHVPRHASLSLHTAPSAHAHWHLLTTEHALPAAITIPCRPTELPARVVRLVLRRPRGFAIGTVVLPLRSLLARPARTLIGRRAVLLVRAAAGSFAAAPGLAVGIASGMSACHDVRGCVVRVRRVGGGYKDVGMAEAVFGREGCRVEIRGNVLWFGIAESDSSFVRVIFDVVRKGRLRGETVVGGLRIGLNELRKIEEGQVLKVGWWGGGVNVTLLAVVERCRRTAAELTLELRLTR